MPGESAGKGRVLRLPEVRKLIGLGRTSIYERMKQSSEYYDPTFPEPIKVGERAVGWYEKDVLRWVAARPKRAAKSSAKSRKSETVASAQRVQSTRPAKPAEDAARPDSELFLDVQTVLAEIARSGKVVSLNEFNERVRARTGGSAHLADELLDDIDLAAYRTLKLFPTVVVQERKSPLKRVHRLASTVGIELSRDQVKDQRARLFLAQLGPADPKPIDFHWIDLAREAPVLRPVYERAAAKQRPRKTRQEMEAAAAMVARYNALIVKGD